MRIIFNKLIGIWNTDFFQQIACISQGLRTKAKSYRDTTTKTKESLSYQGANVKKTVPTKVRSAFIDIYLMVIGKFEEFLTLTSKSIKLSLFGWSGSCVESKACYQCRR